MITWASHQDGLCLGELAGSVRQGTSYVGSYGSSLQASRSLPLAPLESILQVKHAVSRRASLPGSSRLCVLLRV